MNEDEGQDPRRGFAQREKEVINIGVIYNVPVPVNARSKAWV